MGIQINGQTDTITAIDGQMTISGTDLSTNTLDLSTINATGVSTFAGNIDANGDLDVDGHTELDAVNVSGFLTATSAYYSGDVTVLGTLTYEDVTNVDVVGIATARAGLRINGGGLYVTGVSTFNGDLSITDKIVHEGDTDTAIRFPSNDTFTVETAGSERLRVTSGGYAGIGTDTPDGRLHIYSGSSNPTRVIIQGDGSSTAAASLILHSSDESANWRATGTFYYDVQGDVEWFSGRPYGASDAFSIHRKSSLGGSTGNSTANPVNSLLLLNSSGNLGIGTDNPDEKLEVYGGNIQQYNENASGGTGLILHNYAAGGGGNTLPYSFIRAKSNPIRNAGEIRFGRDSAYGSAAEADSHISFWTAKDDTNTERLRITSGGNIGIGTDNPGAILEVAAAANAQRHLRVITHNSGDSCLQSVYPSNGTLRSIALEGSTVDFYTDSGSDTTGTFRGRFDSSGSLGINTTAPGATLDVRGSAFLSPLSLTSGGDGSWIKSAYGAISNSVVSSLNNLLIGQNMRGYLNSDGGSTNNNYYHTNTYSSGTMGYAGLEFGYGGIAKFFTGTPATTADATFTPTERLRIGPSGQIGLSGENYGTSGQVLTSQGSGSAPQWATPAGGKILQVVSVRKTDAFSTSSSTYVTITGLTATITPSSASSKILITYSLACGGRNSDNSGTYIRLYRGGTPPHIGDQAGSSRERATMAINNQGANVDFYTGHFLDSPNTTNSITYEMKIRKRDSVTVYINQENGQNDADSIYYGRYPSTITLMEVEA